jgi:GntR family transcriptional regulator/MocR family aminotransferase
MLPTLRMGFVITPPSLTAAVHKAKYVSDWHSPSLVQAALARFIDEGDYARHVRRASAVYRERHDLIAETLARDFANDLQPIPSSTGLHVTAFATRTTAADIAGVSARAADAGVAVQVLSSFALSAAVPPGLVLGYGAIDTRDIAEGLRRLRTCFPRGRRRRT